MSWLILYGMLGVLLLLLARVARAGILPELDEPAPDFALPDQDGVVHSPRDYAGRWLVLYFYPRDDTPGCTKEACAFRDGWQQLNELGASVLGVSVDNAHSHAAFAGKYRLPFPLLADEKGEVAARYGVLLDLGFMKMARRCTFVIDPQGRISEIYDKVDSSRHAGEITEDLKKWMAGGKA